MSKLEVNTVAPQCGTTLTLGESGDTVTLGTGASQSGFGRTGTVDWDTSSIKTATFTAANGSGYFANTSGGAFNMNLPAGSAGAIVSVVDYTNTFQNNALTVVPNGSEKIGGVAANATLSTEGQSVTFVYVDATEGWKNVQDSTSNAIGATFISATGGNSITTCGNFKIHTFTGPGTFCVASLANVSANNEISYTVIAGGGGGGSSSPTHTAGGGGGAGGYREKKSSVDTYTASPKEGGCTMTITAAPFPVSVGGGGAGGAAGFNKGTNGVNSVFNSITSTGGGGGATYNTPPANSGGSGGGGGSFPHPNNPNVAGSGNTPSVSPSQGENGGSGAAVPQSSNVAGGGGGGAGGAGCNAGSGCGGDGGDGTTTSITGSPVTRAGGGGGAGTSVGAAGPGGGGAGKGLADGQTGNAGTDNTGGGGGGVAAPSGCGTSSAGGNGGSGIVIIRYKYQ